MEYGELSLKPNSSEKAVEGSRMPYSAPYIYYVAKVIPDIVKSYLQRGFQVSLDMADFYLSVLNCAECAIGVRGYWRNHLNFLMCRNNEFK